MGKTFKYLEVDIRSKEEFYSVNQYEIKLSSEQEFEEFLLKSTFRFKADELRFARMICDLKNDVLSFEKVLTYTVEKLEKLS